MTDKYKAKHYKTLQHSTPTCLYVQIALAEQEVAVSVPPQEVGAPQIGHGEVEGALQHRGDALGRRGEG